MQTENSTAGQPLPAIATTKTISDAMKNFFVNPTVANKQAAVSALQAYLLEMEKSNEEGFGN